jgi:hypothetical protein
VSTTCAIDKHLQGLFGDSQDDFAGDGWYDDAVVWLVDDDGNVISVTGVIRDTSGVWFSGKGGGDQCTIFQSGESIDDFIGAVIHDDDVFTAFRGVEGRDDKREGCSAKIDGTCDVGAIVSGTGCNTVDFDKIGAACGQGEVACGENSRTVTRVRG